MILAGILMGGGAAYFGTRISHLRSNQQQNNRRYEYGQRLVDRLSIRTDQETAKGALLDKMPLELAVAAGMVAAGGFLWWANATGMTPLLLANRLILLLRDNPFGPALYLTSYTVGPLILFPASLLTVAGGLVFGPVTGVALALVGSTVSSMIAYGIGRRLRELRGESIAKRMNNRRGYRIVSDTPGDTANDRVQGEHGPEMPHLKMLKPYIERMQSQPFSTTVLMHLLFLPLDMVSYGAGILALDWRPFLLGTMVGALPSTLFLAQAGASLHGGVISGVPHLNPVPLSASGVIFIGGIAVARRLNQRQQGLLRNMP